MEEFIVLSDAPVLIPNPSHQNFTQTEEIIPAGTKIKGSEKDVKGKRRGEPFTYKLFFTDNNKIIYLNRIKKMEKSTEMKTGIDAMGRELPTEVKIGIDAAGEEAPTIIKVPGYKHFTKNKILGTSIVGASAFAFCKYKGYAMKKTAIITIIAAVSGYFIGEFIDKKSISIVKPK